MKGYFHSLPALIVGAWIVFGAIGLVVRELLQ